MGLEALLAAVRDGRPAARIKTWIVVRTLRVMILARLGSLNRLEFSFRTGTAMKWLGGKLPSADTLGRVAAVLDCATLRPALQEVSRRRKRSRSVKAPADGLIALVLDGQECACSTRRTWSGGLERQVTTGGASYPQSYHRLVAASLIFEGGRLLLDAERQEPGEDEVSAALRLFERVVQTFPPAFQVVIADGLYARAEFFRRVLAHGKEVVTVLKDERRELLCDLRSLLPEIPPVHFLRGKTRCTAWDVPHLTSWASLGRPVRVVRSLETSSLKPQRTRTLEQKTSEWIWVTTLSAHRASTRTVARLGHARWAIENEGGFNELVNTWNADHVYKHDVNAILAFWLLTFLAYNLFHTFRSCNLKPILRLRLSLAVLLDCIAADFHSFDPLPDPHPP